MTDIIKQIVGNCSELFRIIQKSPTCIEVHNNLADYGSILFDIYGQELNPNQILECHNNDITITNILSQSAKLINETETELVAEVLEPGNILKITRSATSKLC